MVITQQDRERARRSLTVREAADLAQLTVVVQIQILDALVEHADWRGSRRRVVTTPPTPGSRRYLWRKRRRT